MLKLQHRCRDGGAKPCVFQRTTEREQFRRAVAAYKVSVFGVTSTSQQQCISAVVPRIRSWDTPQLSIRSPSLRLAFAVNVYDGMGYGRHKTECSHALNSSDLIIKVTSMPQFKGFVWSRLAPKEVAYKWDYIWLFDDDLNFHSRQFELDSFLYTFSYIQASMAQPSIMKDLKGNSTNGKKQLRSSDWTFLRYDRMEKGVVAKVVTKIEVMTPFIRSDIWRDAILPVLNAVPVHLLARTIGRIGYAWCGLAAKARLQHAACAIINFPIIHENTRSMDVAAAFTKKLTTIRPIRGETHGDAQFAKWLATNTDGAHHRCDTLEGFWKIGPCWGNKTRWTDQDMLSMLPQDQASRGARGAPKNLNSGGGELPTIQTWGDEMRVTWTERI
mmetsp:Transcript_10182/g.17030  ORF Transcript_10182/g.17030 Transcript_10182/m.17030 type:complete len:386 (-) Transcript_10182:162-1319(-)